MSLFRLGNFTLAGGAQSSYKIDCDFLDDGDWRTLAFLLTQRVRAFSEVLGVPEGGKPFAYALESYADPDAALVLIVDDVWTTGGSMAEFERQVGNERGWATGIERAVAFARTPVPISVTALFTLSPPPPWALKETP